MKPDDGIPKTTVVTGASHGLGFAIASLRAERGDRVVILARNEKNLEKAVVDLRANGGEVHGFACDIRDPKRLRDVAHEVEDRFGGIDLLVLNAGSIHTSLVEEGDDEWLREDVETNLIGTMRSAKAFLPLLDAGSRMLFISSGFALMGAAGYGPYCASKAGIIRFAESLRRELLHRGVTVQVACPGDMDTPQYHEEQKAMPEWMNVAAARKAPMDPRVAAERILKQSRSRRFLIVVSPEIKTLLLGGRYLPEAISRFLLDRLFPRPE